MKAGNLLTIIGSNLRLNVKRTLLPAMLLLLIIPIIYGTSHLDSVKSADCLERMAALIGLPLFVPLLKPEQDGDLEAMIALRPFPYRAIIALRTALSAACAFALILVFEGSLRICGCSFPVFSYAIRTLAAAIALGFVGLLASAVSGSTAAGFLVSFCWYCVLQTTGIGAVFKPVSNGINAYQILLLSNSGAASIFFCNIASHPKRE